MKKGIYTLANDTVYDQLVALLNSIEANVSKNIPICIIPYDDNLEKVKEEVKSRQNVTLFKDKKSIKKWEKFAKEVWAAHPAAKTKKRNWLVGGHTIRKFCAFDGPFDKFAFYDVDSLAMKPLDNLFKKLDKYDFIFDDWEHNKPEAYAMLNYPIIEQTSLFKKSEIMPKMHGMDFFGSKQGIFNLTKLNKLKEQLIGDKKIEWLKGMGIWDEVPLFNYMTLQSGCPLFNFTQSLNGKDRTGNCANADPFVNINNVLYNKEGLKPIHRIHYMGYPSILFKRLWQGEDVNIPHQDIFLYYRFMKEPERKPVMLRKASFRLKFGRFIKKALNKRSKYR